MVSTSMNKRVRVILVSALLLASISILFRLANSKSVSSESLSKENPNAVVFPFSTGIGTPSTSPGNLGSSSVRTANPLKDLPILTWSPQVVEQVFASNNNATRHRKMVALLMDAPAEHKPDLADHVANLTPDDDYAPVAWLISRRGVEGGAMVALLQDLHHRPADIKLPIMAEILSQEDHPGAPEAERALTVYLQVSHGYPSNAWLSEVEKYLANN